MQNNHQTVTKGFLIAAAVLTPLFGTLFFVTLLANASEYNPLKSVIFSLKQNTEHSFEVVLSGNDARLNAAEVELFYDPNIFHVVAIEIEEALCDPRFIMSQEIDNNVGRLYYACGTLTPFAKSSTTLATVYVDFKNNGASEVHFSSTSTNALAHDGYGTNLTKERLSSTLSFSG